MLKNDLKNDIEKTLQAHCPEPPEGFAERMDNKAISLMQKKQERNVVKGKSRFRLPVLAAAAVLVLCIMTAATRELIIRPDSIRARETTTPLVTALSEGHGEATGSAALSEDAVMRLEDEYPGLINELKPVNMRSDQQGVRFDLISALIRDQELYMLYTIQDLEGERVGANVITSYDDNSGSGDKVQSNLRLDYNEAEHWGIYLRRCEVDPSALDDGQLMMSFRDLGSTERDSVDLLPMLKQYGKTTEGIAFPEDFSVQSDNLEFMSDMYTGVLDYTQPLDETLFGTVKLTGIGWIDNKLHVQIQIPDASVTSIGQNAYSSWMISPIAALTEGKDRRDVDYDRLSWGYSAEREPAWQEFVWEISPEDQDRLDLRVYMTHVTKTLDAKWEFQVPVDTILAKTGTETAASAADTFTDDPVLLTEEAIIRDVMDAHVEDISYDELRPIGLSTEKQGIRMDVVSGCRKGNKAYFLLTTQDLNGKYNEYECSPTFAYEHEDNSWDGYEVRLNINRAEGKTTWLYRVDLSKVLPTENSTIRAGMKQLSFSERKEIDLLPMLKEYGRTEEGVTPPKESLRSTLDGKPIENKLKALDYQESLDIHLDGNVFLSAIGWIDNQLHVQFQNKSWALMQQEYPDIPYDNYMMAVNCSVKDKAFKEVHAYENPMSWRETYEGPSWEESVFNCTPEDLDRMELYTNETISKGVLDDDWTVGIPMEMIRDETSEETAVQEEKPAEPAAFSNKEEVYLAYAYPGLMEELKPVNVSCEKQGIRADVLYALIKDQKLYVVYSLQDLKGDRIKDNLNTYTYYLDNLGGTGLYSMRLGQDETEEHKATFLKVYDIPDPVQTDGKLVVNLIGLMTEEYTTIDLLPLLKKYGKTVEGIDKPEDILAETMDWSAMSFSNVDLSKYPTILDYKQPLDETLEGPVSLTGIGWIDNKLHVQIYNPDETTVTMGDTTYPSWMGSSRLAITDREDSRNPEYDILSWDAPSGSQTAWKKYAEYVWEITPDDIDHLELKADIYHYQKISDTTWKIEIPVASILEETDQDTAAQKVETSEEALLLEEEANRRIEERWPGITKELKPVNMICDKQGIRLEVTSALMKGNKSWFVFSLQDLEEDRISMYSGFYVDMWNSNGDKNNVTSMELQLLYSSGSEHKAAYAVCMEYNGSYKSEGNDYIVQYKGIGVTKQTSLDLLPFLEEYGNAAESMEAPAEVVSAYSSGNFGESRTRKGMKILDYTRPLDVELGKDVCLTGIGWIDDQLHVQICDGQQYELVIGQEYFNPLYCSVGTYFPGQPDDQLNNVDEVYWHDGEKERREYVFNCRPDQADKLDLHANMTEITDVVRDTWEVRIPLEDILAEGEETTGQETAAPAV